MLLDSVVHFTKAASVIRQVVPKSVVSHLFGGIDITQLGAPIYIFCLGRFILIIG